MANKQSSNKGQIIRRTIKGKVQFFKDGEKLPNKSGEPRFEKQQQRKAKAARQAREIKKFVSKNNRVTFTQGGKRLPAKKGLESFNKQQAAFNVFRFSNGVPASRDVQQTLRAYPRISKAIKDKLFKNSDDFKNAKTNEEVMAILNKLISEEDKTIKLITLIDNPEFKDRIMDKPVDIYNLMDVLKQQAKDLGWKKPKVPKLKVIFENGNFVTGKAAIEALFDWDTEIFEQLKKKFGFAVGGYIPLRVKFISPFIVVDLREMNDEWIMDNARFFGSDPQDRGIKNFDGTAAPPEII
jgi:hypothetical protein